MEPDVISMEEVESLLKVLDTCWIRVIKNLDDSSITSVWEMLEIVRPKVPDGIELSKGMYAWATEDHALFKEGRKGLFASFVAAFGFAAGLRLEVERGTVLRSSALAQGAMEHVGNARELILEAGAKKRSRKASHAATLKSQKLYGHVKAFVIDSLNSLPRFKSKMKAAERMDDLLNAKYPRIEETGRVRRIAKWFTTDEALAKAFEANQRKSL